MNNKSPYYCESLAEEFLHAKIAKIEDYINKHLNGDDLLGVYSYECGYTQALSEIRDILNEKYNLYS